VQPLSCAPEEAQQSAQASAPLLLHVEAIVVAGAAVSAAPDESPQRAVANVEQYGSAKLLDELAEGREVVAADSAPAASPTTMAALAAVGEQLFAPTAALARRRAPWLPCTAASAHT
jgi:hypothetical protein